MERTLIKDISEKEGQGVLIKGRVTNVRALSNLTFIQIQDYSSSIQVVFEKSLEVKVSEAIEITGKAIKDERSKTGYEIQGKELKIVSPCSEELPFDLSKKDLNLQLSTLLDNRTLSLRHPKTIAIFKLYDILLKAYETVMREEGFTEVKTPKTLEAASEGGANFFKVDYFEKEAYLAQSPQFYKQILTGVFERVFEIGPVFRAEPHFTTRHVNEYISLDAEMAFIESFRDVTAMITKVFKGMFRIIAEEGKPYLEAWGAEVPEVPDQIPHVKLAEIRKIIKKKYDYEIPAETDIDPEGERLACRYAKEEFGSDFIFVTHYPWKDKPFYTMPSPDNPEETEGFDLLFKGLELITGSQRIHDYAVLVENMKKKGVKPEGMEFYLDTFKYGMAPHGGWGLGSERIIQQLLGLPTIKEAILFPRDVKRLSP
jgi:nondiscriminating aspartyl-tRNA synthetase